MGDVFCICKQYASAGVRFAATFWATMLSHRKSIREELLTGSEELLIYCGKLQYSSRNLQAIFSKLQR